MGKYNFSINTLGQFTGRYSVSMVRVNVLPAVSLKPLHFVSFHPLLPCLHLKK